MKETARPAPLPNQALPERSAPGLEALRGWATELGFASLGVADLDLEQARAGLRAWLDAGMHGTMDYMARHERLRTHPGELLPGALSALMVTMDYAPNDPQWRETSWQTISNAEDAYIARYALGRDYHKVVRSRLQKLADRIGQEIGPFGYRAFCDSGPVLEVELAQRAGLGWRGKHTLLIDSQRGSMFFLGTLYTDLPLAKQRSQADHCGRCERCMDVCPTGAIVAPYRLDARRCIAYLTIEHEGSIAPELRPLIGNRVFGCDDCQLACPWNRFAAGSRETDFAPRHGLDSASLVELFGWSREMFETRTAASAIRRAGYERWLRNIAVAMGNAREVQGSARETLITALRSRRNDPSPLVREHVAWALEQFGGPG